MASERAVTDKIRDNFAIVTAFGLLGLGLYTYRLYIQDNLIVSLLLLTTSTLSMFIILRIWRAFTEKYAPDIIYWTSQQKWLRKAVAGGSFSYYEYKDNYHKIGLFEPISRFLSMMIAFIGFATTFANALGLRPESPAENLNSAIIWAILILLIPVILTPIVPIIWSMEDLHLKSWNAKSKTNVRVSQRYKARFNSFIAITTLGVAFTLSRETGDFVQDVVNFLTLLANGVIVLTYPIAVLTLLYYFFFRGTVIEKIKDRMSIPMAQTKLIYRNSKGQILDSDGHVIAEPPASEEDLVIALANGRGSPTEEELQDQPARERRWFWQSGEAQQDMSKARVQSDQNQSAMQVEENRTDPLAEKSDVEEDKNLPQKISNAATKAVKTTGDAVVSTGKAIVDSVSSVGKSISDNTVGRIFGKNKNGEKEEVGIKSDRSGGSATAGLWDDEKGGKDEKSKKTDSEEKEEYKYKGGSATEGLWDKEYRKKKDKK